MIDLKTALLEFAPRDLPDLPVFRPNKGMTQISRCETCDREFPHERRRSRKPKFCSKRCACFANSLSRLTKMIAWTKTATRDIGCLLWPGLPMAVAGYGRVRLMMDKHLVHRIVWTFTFGPIPDGLFVLHKCDVRLCCSPYHLFLGTNDDNMKDMTAKGRSCKGYVRSTAMRLLVGYPIKKLLTDKSVREIRIRWANGETIVALAKEFGVSQPVISYIVHRKTWKHVA